MAKCIAPVYGLRTENRRVNCTACDKELSTLLARVLLVPVNYNTTLGRLREVSPLLSLRNGLSTNEDSVTTIADKLAVYVNLELN